jgi:cyclophilin family peptidyl-prolyl cis-trans isomerase
MLRLRVLVLPLLAGLLAGSVSAGPPIARFQSVLGNFEVLLDPAATPISVTNFASYANRGIYDSTIIHRSTTYNPTGIQIVQGGGFELVGNMIEQVTADPPIPLEAGVANARGTLAMARTTQPNSATSQWYFNVQSNPLLDFNYAVFGRVMGTGMSVVDAIGQVTVYNASEDLGATFGELPLLANSLAVQNLVLINSVRVAPFAITNITRTADTTELRWTALSANTPVRVERTADLAGEPWTTIASNNTTGVFTDTTAPTRGAYYRIVTEP